MLRATFKSLLAHKLRMAMSAFAIVLGVAFVSGTFVFTDTLNSSFTAIFRQTAPDVTVRPAKAEAAAAGGFTGADTRVVPADLVGTLEALPGVARADGDVTDQSTFIIGTGPMATTKSILSPRLMTSSSITEVKPLRQ